MIAIRRILVPVDFSPCADRAIDYAAELAEKFSAALVLVYVIPDLSTLVPDAVMPVPTAGPDMEELLKSAREAIDKLVAQKKLERFQTTVDVRVGSAATQIVEAATADKADLVVIGTHGRSGLAHFFLGSVAERVVRTATCPVLTVRA